MMKRWESVYYYYYHYYCMLCDDHLCHSTSVLHISIQFVSAELNAFWIWAFNLN